LGFATYQDAVLRVKDYLGAGDSDVVMADLRRAVLDAYRDLANAHRWSYLYAQGRIITSLPYNIGTIAYTHTGGTYERMVTLTGGIWPTYAAACFIQVGLVAYRVDQRISATVVTLNDPINPGSDIAAGTEYTLYRDTYLLPEDYTVQDQALYELNFGGMHYEHPRYWLYANRYCHSEGVPHAYTITGDPAYPGRMVLRLWPWPTMGLTVDYLYRRRPRTLAIYAVPATASASSSSSLVTATTPIFTRRVRLSIEG